MTFRLASILAGLALLAAGCGGGGDGDGVEGASGLRVGLVTDIGGLNDRGFNQLAYRGLKRAEKQLGVEVRVLTSGGPSDYVPNLSTLARQRYDLVVAVGFLMANSVDTVATQFPNTRFAIVDFSQAELKGKPKNVTGLLFKEQEAGYLVGYLAGLVATGNTVSSVGGLKIPPVDRFIAGYRAGVRAAKPGVETLNGYSQDFVDQAKCKEIALNQIAAGSKVVFQVAGACGLGALDAAKQRKVSGIGVDADQAHLGPHVLTSALKKVDVAVYEAIEDVRERRFQGGRDVVFGVESGGVGLGKVSPKVPRDVLRKVEQVRKRIAAGDLSVPTSIR